MGTLNRAEGLHGRSHGPVAGPEVSNEFEELVRER